MCHIADFSPYASSDAVSVQKGPGQRLRKANSYIPLRDWHGTVNRTCQLEDSGFLCQRQWVQHGHQSNVKVNGVFFPYLYVVMSMQFRRSDTLEGKARNEEKPWHWKEDDSYILICKWVSVGH